MKNIKKLRKGKVIAASLIVVLIALIVSIIKISSIDKYAGLVRVEKASLSSISTKLKANISDLTEDNNITVNGYDEIDYNISYTLSEVVGDRDVIINAKLDENDIYASFKEVTGPNITSVLSSNRKEITITISNLPSGQTINSKITMIIENAPNGYNVSPIVRIKESTSEEYTSITVKPVTVTTTSVQGIVMDEDGNTVSNILITLKKNNEIIKETYTNANGLYILSDITPDTYSVVVNEENYENLELNNVYIENGNLLNLIVKKVYPYSIETNKYITRVELNNLGTGKDYLYNDVTLAQIPVKKVNNLHGKIYYKITVQNTGEKTGIISAVKDELPEGLSFDESLNSGYELKNGIIYNRNLEGVELGAGEVISDTLVLTIENTDVARTYINKVSAKGELYEHVVYLLNGSTYKTLDVLEGEKIDEPTVSVANFDGWYTDEKLTNKYNFNLPVNKDLILYGVTKAKHTVVFNDKHPETLVVEEYDRKTVNNGEPVSEPNPNPQKTGYDFCGWVTDNDTPWDFYTPVVNDLTLTSKYCIKSYDVEFYDKSASNGAEYAKILTISKEYKSTVSNSEAPDLSNVWAGHTFLRWTTDQDGQQEYNFTSLITGPVKLYAQYSLQDRVFIFNDENRVTEKRVEYGSTVQPIADQGKDGHTFKHWSLEVDGATPYDFSTPIYVSTTVYAVYQINTYNVIFNDTDPWTNVTEEYDNQTVEHGDKATEPVEPSKEGHTFCGWKLNGNNYDFETEVTGNITLESCYTKDKVNVTFMDGDNQFAVQSVDYADYAHDTATHPTKEHNIFTYWTEDGTNPFDFDNTQIKTPKTLYSTYEEVVAPTISHTPLYWTNDKVLVTISSNNPNYTFKYKVDDGTYQDYTEPFELDTNSTIVAKSIYGDAESVITSHEVTNIDKLNPTIGTITPAATPYTITLVGTVSDAQSGVKQINVYANNNSAGTTNGTPINVDLKDYEKSKDMNFVISGLTDNTEYSIRIEVVDGAGNVSTETIPVTTPGLEPICQIISIDGVDLNPDDYIPFPLLELAIEDTNCTSKCTIQMLKGTTESVEILDTQDITLDLNGKTVAGVLPGYTVNNQGEFTLIDHAQEAGGLINANGIAVLNTTGAKLTLGEGSSEEPVGSETRIVSTTVPYVFGESYGVYSESNSEFSFFDGKVKGTNAIQGHVTETEYLYNATSATAEEYEEVTLAILTDPEARLNKSIYYGNASNAALDAQGGTLTPTATNATFLSGFTHIDEELEYPSQYSRNTGGYPFYYDANTDTLSSTNQFYGSMAFTETIIDLTDYEDDQVFEIEYHVDPNVDGTYGTANFKIVKLDENMIEPQYGLSYAYNHGDLQAYKLQKGYKYKAKFSFVQPISIQPADFVQESNGLYTITSYSNVPESKLVITRASLHKEERTDFGGTAVEGNNIPFGFYYDQTTNTIRSTGQYGSGGNHYGYIELDLTNKTGEYDLSVTMSFESWNSNTFAVYISEDNPYLYTYTPSSYDCVVYAYSYSYSSYTGIEEFNGYPKEFNKGGPFTGSRKLTGGKKYYINMEYWKNNNSPTPTQEEYEQYGISDQMIINSINLYKVGSSSTDIDIVNEMVGNAFDFSQLIDGSYYSILRGNKGEYRDSYVKIDLTDSPVDKLLEVDSHFYSYNELKIYVTSNNRGLTTEELKDRTKSLLVKDDVNATGNFYYKSATLNNNTLDAWSNNSQDYLLEKGNVYYIHFNTRMGVSLSGYGTENYDCESTYGYCGNGIRGLKLKDVDELLYTFGNTPINVGTVDNYSNTEETTTISLTDRSVTPVVESAFNTGYVYNSETEMYELEKEMPYYHAAGWTGKIDLTNETEAKTYEFVYKQDQTGNLSSYDYYTVDELYPLSYKNSGGPAPVYPPSYTTFSGYSGSSYITLEPGHIYYLYHIVYRNSSYPINGDAFRIEEVKGNRTTEYTKGEKIVSFNENVDEIQILKDIELKNTFLIDYNKETVLDLNGYKITSSLTDAIIENYGKLTIIDSDYEGQTGDNKTHNGIIISNASDLIMNRKDAELIIKNAVLKIDGEGRRGIYNEGNLTFVADYDSKIYVNKYRDVGIYNTQSGVINSTNNSIEIIMNYNNQANYNGILYNQVRIERGDYYGNYINTGVYNEGFYNAYGLKVTGKNGSGFWNTSNGVAVINYSQIDVDINNNDKRTYNDTEVNNGVSLNAYDYKYYWREWNSWMGRYYDYYETINDYSIKNEGTMSIFDGSVIGHRIYNSKDLVIGNGAMSSENIHNTSKLDIIAGGLIYNVCNTGLMMGDSSTYFATTDNYNKMQLHYGSSNNSTINNHGSGEVEVWYVGAGIVNNYDNGEVILLNSSSPHIYNEGTMTLNNTNVIANPDNYEEAIKNSGILNLNNGVNVGDKNNPTKYGIFMKPKTTVESNKYVYDRPTGQGYYYDEYTYRQTKINIGTPESTTYDVVIIGKEVGMTGPCYYNAEHKLFGTTKKYTRYIQKYDGEVEPIIQSDYDQNLCDVNFYAGKVASTDYPGTYNRTISVPIRETLDDGFAYWDNGLVVQKNTNIPDNVKPASIGGTEYSTLQAAIDSVADGGSATIDIQWFYSVGKTVIPEGKNITINLVDGTNNALFGYDGAFENNGNLTITGTGTIHSLGKYVVDNNGNFTVNSGTYTNNWNYRKMERSLINNKGTAVINNANLNQMDLYNQGNLTINNGDYNGTMIYGAGEDSVTTVTGGFFETSSSAVATYYGFKTSYSTTIDNKELRHIFELNNEATAIIDGLNTTTDTRYTTFRPIAHLSNSTIELKNSVIGDLSGDNTMRFISAEGNSNVIVDSGIYKSIYIDNNGSNVTINDGNLSGYSNDSDGKFNLIYMQGQTPVTSIAKGVLEAPQHVVGLSDFTQGYNISIGTKGDLDDNDEVVCSKTNPTLVAESYAVAKYGSGSGTGFFGFYDGILKGKSAALDINVDEIEVDFEIIDDTQSPYFVKYLDQRDLVKNVTTGVIYKTFQKAFNEATNGDELETLRTYTNTKTNPAINIPETSNFTLKIKHLITINNPEFIINNGNATFESAGAGIFSNVSSNIFVNNGTLNLNSLNINNLKGDGSRPELVLNNETGTLNINGSSFETVQHTFVNNKGTLNIGRVGTNDCYDTTRFKINYVPGDGPVDVALKNTGTANIDYLVLVSEYYNQLIENSGTMVINHSVLDQTSDLSSFTQPSVFYGDPGLYMIENTKNLEIKNSSILFIPESKTYGGYSIGGNKIGNYFESSYIKSIHFADSDNAVLTLDNNNMDISILGIVKANSYSSDRLVHNYINIKNTNVNSVAYGVIATGVVNINLEDNVFNIRDSIIGEHRNLTTGYYSNSARLYFPAPDLDNERVETDTMDENSIINIDGGTYNTSAVYHPGGVYTVSTSYATTCNSSTSVDKSITYQSDIVLPVSAISSIGTLNINDATINIVSFTGYNNPYYEYVAPYYNYRNDHTEFEEDVNSYGNLEHSGEIVGYYIHKYWLGVITSFGTTTITNSEINAEAEFSDGSEGIMLYKGYGDNAILILGEKDSEYDNSSPLLTTRLEYPISFYGNMGGIKFYDGLIRSTDTYYGITLSGNENDMDKHFMDNEIGYVITGNYNTRYLTKENIIKNVTQDIGYSNIQTAIDEAQNGDELQILGSTIRTSSSANLTISGKTLTIDTNCLTLSNDISISNGSNVTINSSACPAGAPNGSASVVSTINVYDTSKLSISSGTRGTINAYGSSNVTLSGDVSLDVNGYDSSEITYHNNTNVDYGANDVIMNDQSSIIVNDGIVSTLKLNDDTSLSTICTNNSSVSIGMNEYFGSSVFNTSVPITLSCGKYQFINKGTITLTGGVLNETENYGTMTLDGVTVNQGRFVNNYGELSVLSGDVNAVNNYKNATISGGTLRGVYMNSERTSSTTYITGGNIVTLNGHSDDYSSATGIVTGGTIEYVLLQEDRNLTIKSGTIGYIEVLRNGNLTIGEKDGNVDGTTPTIDTTIRYSSNMPGLKVNEGGIANFYDGSIRGYTSKGAVMGRIIQTEDTYKITTIDNGDNTETAYLTPITVDDSKVAMVNGINYNSLQQAINKAALNVENGIVPTITIYSNIELDADLTIPSGFETLKFHITSNGFTISTNGHNVPSNIWVDGEQFVDPSLGGDIINGLRNVLGLNSNTKDVLIYEMSDGSTLSTENHYRLYKYDGSDYDLVTMEKGDEVARYNPGRGIENMKPIKGRLYLTNLEPGDYKVVDDNNSELVFTINDDLTLSGHVKEYIPSSNRIEANGEAKLLISIQTGIRKINYMFIAISLIAVLSVMFVIKKKSQNDSI